MAAETDCTVIPTDFRSSRHRCSQSHTDLSGSAGEIRGHFRLYQTAIGKISVCLMVCVGPSQMIFSFLFSNLIDFCGGEDGIRTHETLLESTPLAGERLRPLGHLSAGGDINDNPMKQGFSRGAGTGQCETLPDEQNPNRTEDWE